MTVNAPMTAQAAPGKLTAADVLRQSALFRQRFGPFIDQTCGLNNIPDYLLTGIVLIEDFALDAAIVHVNSSPIQNAVGLGQHKPYSATDILVNARVKKLLTTDKKTVLARQLGLSRLASIEKIGLGQGYVVTATDLKDPEFNLMLTGIYLSLLVSQHTQADVCRVDLVSYRYNQGYYVKLPANTSTTDGLLNGIQGEGKKYVLTMCGRGGMLDLLT